MTDQPTGRNRPEDEPRLPALETLNDAQRVGAACARCGAHLYGAVAIGAVQGVLLWACLLCARPDEGGFLLRHDALCEVCHMPEDNRPGGGFTPVRSWASASGPGYTVYAHTRCTVA